MDMTNNLNLLITYILYGDFGILTTVPYFLFRVLLPIITSFYLLQSFLTKSHLLQILSCKIDRHIKKFGLSSNTLLPLLLGFGCVTVALGTLQTNDSKREKRIAQILLCLIVPCSAQLVINTILIFNTAKFYLITYIFIIMIFFCIYGFTLNKLFPEYKHSTKNTICSRHIRFTFPNIFSLIYISIKGGIGFLCETAIPFAIGNIIVSVLYFFGYVHKLCLLASPIICDFLHLPEEAAAIFILSALKKDLAASSLLSLYSNGVFSDTQIFITIIMLTLSVPCFASMIILFKNEKKTMCLTIWFICILISIVVGKILSSLLMLPLLR